MRKLRKTTRQYIMVSLICTLIIGGTSIVLCTNFYLRMKKNYNESYQIIKKELDDYSKEIYVTRSNISQGEIITKEKLELKLVITSNGVEQYITEDDLGGVALIPLEKGTQVLKSMITEDTINIALREVYFEGIKISPNIKTNDTVDIRISYPNGEDYIVLSKKYIPLIHEDNTKVYLHLEEEEILRMSSALVDAYLYSGSFIYTTKYVEGRIEEESIVTYIPNMQVIELIKNSPNILNVAMSSLETTNRRSLEERLSMERDIVTSSPNFDARGNGRPVSSNGTNTYIDNDGFTYYTEEDYQLGE